MQLAAPVDAVQATGVDSGLELPRCLSCQRTQQRTIRSQISYLISLWVPHSLLLAGGHGNKVSDETTVD